MISLIFLNNEPSGRQKWRTFISYSFLFFFLPERMLVISPSMKDVNLFLCQSILRDTVKTIGFPGGSEVKASASNAEDLGSIPGSGRSSGEGNGNPLQYSCLENPMDLEPGRLPSMGSQRVGHD